MSSYKDLFRVSQGLRMLKGPVPMASTLIFTQFEQKNKQTQYLEIKNKYLTAKYGNKIILVWGILLGR